MSKYLHMLIGLLNRSIMSLWPVSGLMLSYAHVHAAPEDSGSMLASFCGEAMLWCGWFVKNDKRIGMYLKS